MNLYTSTILPLSRHGSKEEAEKIKKSNKNIQETKRKIKIKLTMKWTTRKEGKNDEIMLASLEDFVANYIYINRR